MQLVDWDLATATATRLAPPGPRMELADAMATVEDLRRAAERAERHVTAYTGLTGAATGVAPQGPQEGHTAVVDRPGWIRSNVEGFQTLVDPLLDSVLGSKARSIGPVMGVIGPRATGLEVGGLLAYLST